MDKFGVSDIKKTFELAGDMRRIYSETQPPIPTAASRKIGGKVC
jgi:hypothetical protein